jgi:hypothetical protein
MNTYNGWSNYPTWAVDHWLGNDAELHAEAREVIGRVIDVHGSDAAGEVANELKRWVREMVEGDFDDTIPADPPVLARDLLGYALDCVSWDELASAWTVRWVES